MSQAFALKIKTTAGQAAIVGAYSWQAPVDFLPLFEFDGRRSIVPIFQGRIISLYLTLGSQGIGHNSILVFSQPLSMTFSCAEFFGAAACPPACAGYQAPEASKIADQQFNNLFMHPREGLLYAQMHQSVEIQLQNATALPSPPVNIVSKARQISSDPLPPLLN